MGRKINAGALQVGSAMRVNRGWVNTHGTQTIIQQSGLTDVDGCGADARWSE